VEEMTIDIRALKVGKKVTLSDALPGGGTTGIVIEVSKYRVVVQVDTRREGKDGAYRAVFDYDGNVTSFYDWTDGAGWEWASPCPIPMKIISADPDVSMTLEKSKRDGGGFGKFRAMTLEEAKALPHHALVWVLMTTIAQKFKTYDPGISRFKRWRVHTDIGGLDEQSILDGKVLVEVTSNDDKLESQLTLTV
jgi:hypothetical protein